MGLSRQVLHKHVPVYLHPRAPVCVLCHGPKTPRQWYKRWRVCGYCVCFFTACLFVCVAQPTTACIHFGMCGCWLLCSHRGGWQGAAACRVGLLCVCDSCDLLSLSLFLFLFLFVFVNQVESAVDEVFVPHACCACICCRGRAGCRGCSRL